MSNPVKFTFNRDFDGGSAGKLKEELEKARAEGEAAAAHAMEQGRQQGQNDALASIEQHTQQALGRVAEGIGALFESRAQLENELARQSAVLAHIIATHLAGSLMEEHPLHEIEALVSSVLADTREEPRVLMRVHADVLDPLKDRIDTLSATAGFNGEIVIVPDEALGPQDVRIEWPNGGTDRDLSRLQASVAERVEQYVTGQNQLPEQEAGQA